VTHLRAGWPSPEDSATTAHIENEAVSEHVEARLTFVAQPPASGDAPSIVLQ
jgi:hypothetical protein